MLTTKLQSFTGMPKPNVCRYVSGFAEQERLPIRFFMVWFRRPPSVSQFCPCKLDNQEVFRFWHSPHSILGAYMVGIRREPLALGIHNTCACLCGRLPQSFAVYIIVKLHIVVDHIHRRFVVCQYNVFHFGRNRSVLW